MIYLDKCNENCDDINDLPTKNVFPIKQKT